MAFGYYNNDLASQVKNSLFNTNNNTLSNYDSINNALINATKGYFNQKPKQSYLWEDEREYFPKHKFDNQIEPALPNYILGQKIPDNIVQMYKHGGKISKYSDLSDKERYEVIRLGVQNGMTNLDDIEKAYNEYTEGGSLKQDDYYNNVVLQKDNEQKQQIKEQLEERRTYADGGKINEIQSLFKKNPIEAKKVWDSLSDDDKKAYGVEGGFWNVVNDISHKFGGDDNSKITNRHTSKIHVYKFGESIRDMANMYGVSENDIELVNPSWIDGFKEGQQIIIPDEHDLKIAKMKNYGWDDANERGKYDKEYLSKNVNATLGFDPISYFINGYSYLLGKNLGERSVGENPKNQAWFNRHLGYDRNFKELPLSTVKFTGDYNKDGSLKWPNAEYVGLTQYWKNKIREAIKNGEINPKEDWSNATENGGLVNPLGRFAIRENNNSGIYDVFDTYDFRGNDQDIVPNRNIGYDIEVRDTIHGVKAKPELYDINYTKRK